MKPNYDDAVVGAGILGLAHAYDLARRGRRVLVVERNPVARGASVRNFGMLWPIGQPAGPMRQLALCSLEIWHKVLAAAAVWFARSGSLHVAYHDDEAAVLEEFAAATTDMSVSLLSPRQVRERAPAVRADRLQAGLWSPTETIVDPRRVIAGLPEWLARTLGVHFQFGRTVTSYDPPRLRAGGQVFSAARLWVCAGDDLQTLFPETLQAQDLIRCKLQMMRSQACGDSFRFGPALAAGLTLRHYPAFAQCPSLPALKRRLAAESPEFDRYGIHVLVAQNGDGELVIGDSHEYGRDVEPFDKPIIDRLIVDYLNRFLVVPDLQIAARWHGVYVKHSEAPFLVLHPAEGVTAVTGVGGNGMTLSFGLAERVVREVLGEA
jgi:FAD dependent oxidoreductase TIGR03364